MNHFTHQTTTKPKFFLIIHEQESKTYATALCEIVTSKASQKLGSNFNGISRPQSFVAKGPLQLQSSTPPLCYSLKYTIFGMMIYGRFADLSKFGTARFNKHPSV